MPAAIAISELLSGADPNTPLGAVLVPVLEPSAVAEPPVLPVLVRRASVRRSVRITPTRAGRVRSSVLQTRSRVRVDIEWGPLTLGERNQLQTFFETELQGRHRPLALRPDGPDAPAFPFILTEKPQERQIDIGGYEISAPALEVFAS